MGDDAKSDRKKSTPERTPAPKRAPERPPALAPVQVAPGGLALPAVAQLGNRATLAKLRQGRSLGGGTPLAAGLRTDMERRFDTDFSAVRVHAGPAAAALARTEQAHAFTEGRDIVFGHGEWAPQTTAGRGLLAHELAHVHQQQLGQTRGRISDHDATEADAHRAARAVASNAPVRITEGAGPGIHRSKLVKDDAAVKARARIWITPEGEVNGTYDTEVILAGTAQPGVGSWVRVADGVVDYHVDDMFPKVEFHASEAEKRTPGYTFITTARRGELPGFPPFEIPDPIKPPPQKKTAPPKPPKPPPPKIQPKQPEPEPENQFAKYSPDKKEPKIERLRESLKYDAEDVGKQLHDLSDEDLTDLTPDDREGLLDWLTKDGTRGSDVDNQNSILRLLGTTPESDARPMIESLREDDALRFKKMMSYMDWQHQAALHRSLEMLYFSSLWSGYSFMDLGQAPIPYAPKLDLRDSLDAQQLQMQPDGSLHIVPKKDPFGRDDDLKKFALDFLNPKSKSPVDFFGAPQNDPMPLQLFGFGKKPDDPLANLFPYMTPKMPIIGKRDALTDFLAAPAPTKPIVPLSDANQARLDRMKKNSQSWLTTPEIRKEFEGAAPLDRQLIAEKLGDSGMTEMYEAMGSEEAVILGSQTPLIEGRDKLNDMRAELIARWSNWAPRQRMALYSWMLTTMTNKDLESVLGKLAGNYYLKRSLLQIPGIDEYMKSRGIDLEKFKQHDGWTGAALGAGRGLWNMIDKDEGGAMFITKIPQPFQKQVWDAAMGDVNDVLTPGNIARGVLSEGTMGFSELPFAAYGAVAALVSGGIDIYHGDTEDAGEKIAPIAAMIAIFLIAHKAAGPAGAGVAETTALEEEGLLGPKGKGQFVMKGEVSTAAKNVESVLAANPQIAATAGGVVEALGPEGVAKAAKYMQADAAATRLVAKRGIPGLQALVKAEGDVAAAEAALDRPVPKTPAQLPKGRPRPPPGMSPNEMNEGPVMQQVDPGAEMAPPKTAKADAWSGGVRETLGETSKTVGGITRIFREVRLKGARVVYQLKELSHWGKDGFPVKGTTLERIATNVEDAMKTFWDESKVTKQPNPDPIPGTNIHERINVADAQRLTIVIVVDEPVTAEMQQAATNAVAGSKYALPANGLPPVNAVVVRLPPP